jgi:hypothetical protein
MLTHVQDPFAHLQIQFAPSILPNTPRRAPFWAIENSAEADDPRAGASVLGALQIAVG